MKAHTFIVRFTTAFSYRPNLPVQRLPVRSVIKMVAAAMVKVVVQWQLRGEAEEAA
jgi:hypothetical protein